VLLATYTPSNMSDSVAYVTVPTKFDYILMSRIDGVNEGIVVLFVLLCCCSLLLFIQYSNQPRNPSLLATVVYTLWAYNKDFVTEQRSTLFTLLLIPMLIGFPLLLPWLFTVRTD
jgi:hypothetical protein